MQRRDRVMKLLSLQHSRQEVFFLVVKAASVTGRTQAHIKARAGSYCSDLSPQARAAAHAQLQKGVPVTSR